ASRGEFHGEASQLSGSISRTTTRPFRVCAPANEQLKTREAGGKSDTGLFQSLVRAGMRPERVVRSDVFSYEGPVYDFQTTTGWLGAGGIVASNCRCRVIAR